LRVVGLQAWAWGLWAWGSSIGKGAIIAVIAVGLFLGWSAWERHIGRDQERAANAELARQADSAAENERQALEQENAAAAAHDAQELTAIDTQEGKVRDENHENGDSVLWRADDGWLRSKSAGKGRR
jgi:uncharacterized protein HemX